MKPINTHRRYFFSIVFDYLLLFAVIVPLVLFLDEGNRGLLSTIWMILFGLFSVQDRILVDASIGKRIFGIKLMTLVPSETISFANVFVRRILELMRWSFSFFKISIDIDKISDTMVVSRSYIRTAVPNNQGKQGNRIASESQSSRLRLLRERAFLWDLLFISWSFILHVLTRLAFFNTMLDQLIPSLSKWVFGLNLAIFALYFVFKDMLYGNASIGKRKEGIVVVDKEGKLPSNVQMMIRGYVSLQLYPIEILLFLLKKRQIADMLTYTKVVRIKKTS
ncbi:MAG: hypothetical protein MZU97_22100 [Bacillus subtilis]|nr:hypothetical protein [Bacillus subtilis]